MRTVRTIHLYLGCFFAPLLVFYVSTGWYQTLHPNRNKSLAEKGDWLSALHSVHVDQIYPSASASSYTTTWFRLLVVLMCISFIATVGLGIYLAFRTSRRQWPVWVCLALGIVLPIVLLRLGQHR